MSTSNKVDVAVIGGGMSGLYTAWRLLEARRFEKVAVYEASGRIGGRLLTLHYEGGMRAELGGMRFLPGQPMVWNLTSELKLKKIPFAVDGPHLRWLLRGKHMPLGDVAAANERYDVRRDERGKSPGDLIAGAIDQVLGTAENKRAIEKALEEAHHHYPDAKFPEDRVVWDLAKPHLKYKGVPLWNVGFWNVLLDILSNEAFQFATDAMGYFSLTSNQNAAEAMQGFMLDFAGAKYSTLAGGYSALPEKLEAEVRKAGGQVHTHMRALAIDRQGEGVFRVQFGDPDGTRTGSVDADHVVLAMPRHALEQIGPGGLFNPRSDRLRHLLASVTAIPAFKLFLLYPERWWEKLGIERGRSVCDLPIRQTYYFHPDQASSDPRGLVMASYDDAQAVGYWKGMEEPREVRERPAARRKLQQAFAHFHGTFSGLSEDEQVLPENLYEAPPAMVARAQAQLAQLHSETGKPIEIPEPVLSAYADWSLAPFGGGWNWWEPERNVAEVMTEVQAPLGHQKGLYVTGSAYSGMQGWVEGALTTAEIVLQEQFELSWPKWLPRDAYVGPIRVPVAAPRR
jgi:monoamine oxidase